MLNAKLNRLKRQAEDIIAEEQAEYRARRNTTEQIFSLRILSSRICTMSVQLFQKAFDRVWYAALWATMRKYSINANLVRATEHLYNKVVSAVQMNGSAGEWFKTTNGVRQGCFLSPTLSTFSSKGLCLMLWKNIMVGKHRRQNSNQSSVCR